MPTTRSPTPAIRTGPGVAIDSKPAVRVSRGAVNLGVVSLASGAVLEWIAPLWLVLPDWIRVIASANEAMMFGGAGLMVAGAVIGRSLRKRAASREDTPDDVPTVGSQG